MNENLAVVVIGYDGYSSIWDNFFGLLNKNWEHCPFPVYLMTNKINANFKNVRTITTSDDSEWSRKVKIAVNEIKEEYIFLLLEDFFISSTVNDKDIIDIIEMMEKEKLDYVKCPYKGAFIRKGKEKFKDYVDVYNISMNEKYGISLLPSIWRKDFLDKIVGKENYSPWKFEVDRLKEAKSASNKKFTNCVEVSTNPLNILNGVIQGKYVRSTVKKLKKNGFNINVAEFKIMSFKDTVILKAKAFGLNYAPKRIQALLKNIMRLFGVEFVSDHYS